MKYYVNEIERTKSEYIDIMKLFLKEDWDVYYWETAYNLAIVEFGDIKFQCKVVA